jgi:hypothetical protein
MIAHAKYVSSSGLHDNGQLVPVLKDMFVYHCAVQRLQRLRQSIERVLHERPDTPAAFSLLLIEHRIWTRYVRRAQDIWMTVLTEGPAAGEPIVLTGSVVLDAIATEQLSVARAFRRGLIVVKGPAAARQELKALLTNALSYEGPTEGPTPMRISPAHFQGKPR